MNDEIQFKARVQEAIEDAIKALPVQNAIEDAIKARGVEPPEDLADIVFVTTDAVMPFIASAGKSKALLADLERDYVRAINAVLAAGPYNDEDVYRWRGHAEAYRQVCERIRRDMDLPTVSYRSDEWRQANGVYSDEYLQTLASRR